MTNANPHLSAVAYLVRKYGTKIEGGGYEVVVTSDDMLNLMPPTGMFHEVPDQLNRSVRWLYYPNPTIEGEVVTPESVTPESVTPEGITVSPISVSPSPASLRPTCGHKSTIPHSTKRCNRSENHDGDHSDSETSESWFNWSDTEENK